ncbi:unnamed protein product [Rotaria sordida]|uniref:DOMON domain-containing protein n=1 Tax=Rotaria sordida TaxID=392033 RepID=A0A819FFB7_9BILA|nr:unnamed protein product [Rotaria sordida]CAF3892016.1 unnamed protein product [Rotaria sordida]
MHVKTTGWIGLGISPGRIVFQIDDYSLQIFDHSLAGGMTGADIGVGWIDNVGTLYFQDRYAFNFSKPVIDNTTMDWIGLQGREENGWTAIQFKRLLETCDYMDLSIKFDPCLSNMANGWAVGGEHIVEYPQEAGYPIGSDYPVKYYMIQIHFDNPHLESDRRDSSGIRFYVGEELRQCDIGYLTLGTESNPSGIVIPPKASEFAIDAFCTPKATEV